MDKHIFLEYLAGHGTCPVIFEPFLLPQHAETLIWRRGVHIWDTPAHTIATLADLTERTRADCIFLDLRGRSTAEKTAILEAADAFRDSGTALGCGILGTAEDLSTAEQHPGIDCVCLFGAGSSDRLPVIRMDGSPEEAIRQGACGWHCPAQAEEALALYGKKLRILGGLGAKTIENSSPVTIYSRVEQLTAAYPGVWACGSGGTIAADHYLELISLLGAFARVRF